MYVGVRQRKQDNYFLNVFGLLQTIADPIHIARCDKTQPSRCILSGGVNLPLEYAYLLSLPHQHSSWCMALYLYLNGAIWCILHYLRLSGGGLKTKIRGSATSPFSLNIGKDSVTNPFLSSRRLGCLGGKFFFLLVFLLQPLLLFLPCLDRPGSHCR